ncbi:hypothetical protein AX16_006550 [Volvariella volvacea WC 439]|nr:hypothetical protein AX16_006550 [Volvariella volvacea WC 439]
MSLDQNLFTLVITPSKNDPHVVELVEPSGQAHYRKRRLPGSVYKVEVYDPMTEALLITATAPSASSKTKTLELCNPTMVVELKYTGTISFRWGFKWEEHEFEWKREECYMLRKPDPPILVALTRDIKEQGRSHKTTSVQILDYNLNRFNIEDRKGLEIVMLTALLTFRDSNDDGPKESPTTLNNVSTAPPISRQISDAAAAGGAAGVASGSGPEILQPPTLPPLPPKPVMMSGADRIAEMQAMKGEINEVTVEEEGDVNDYAEYCCRLFEDDITLVSIHSAAAEQVPKVILVVEEIKRRRHKAGLEEEEELYQYVLYDTVKAQKGPRRINLDDVDPARDRYAPPNSLTIHLSKFDMPELQPKASAGDRTAREPRRKEDPRAGKPPPKPPAPSFSASSSANIPRRSSPSPPSNSRPPHKLAKSTQPPNWGFGQQGALNQQPSTPPTPTSPHRPTHKTKKHSGPPITDPQDGSPAPSLYGPHTAHLMAPRPNQQSSSTHGHQTHHLRNSSSFSLNSRTSFSDHHPPSPGASGSIAHSSIAAPTPQKSSLPSFLGGFLRR